MKLNYIELLGEKHPLCFSQYAAEQFCELFGDIEGMQRALTDQDVLHQLRAVKNVLSVLLDAGRRYCALAGLDMPEKSLVGHVEDVIDVSNPEVVRNIFETITGDSERTLEAEAKNADPTQDD